MYIHDQQRNVEPETQELGFGPGILSVRNGGSTLLLVLAALLLVLILGISYMEIVRQDRKSISANTDYIDDVIDSVVTAVSNRLHGDLGIYPWEELTVADDDEFFAEDPVPGAGPDAGDDGDGVTPEEPFDYPGDLDRWLAATGVEENDGVPGQWEFRQVTLLDPTNGFYGPGGVPDLVRVLEATEAENASTTREDPADADGDGIIDSKPYVPPLSQANGVQYFAWVRVIDNSSLLNINSALSLVNRDGSYEDSTDVNAPRGWYPSELDFGKFVSDTAIQQKNQQSAAGFYADDVERFLRARLGDPAIELPPAWSDRESFWLNNVRQYFDFGALPRLGIETEIELRYRNGQNNAGVVVDIEDAALGMPQILRAAYSEASFRGALANIESIIGQTPGTMTAPQNYLAVEPRHLLTTYSGHALYRPSRADPVIGTTGALGPGRLLKNDINQLIADDIGALAATNDALFLRTQIGNVLAEGATGFIPPGAVTQAEYAAQLAASIIDYADRDQDGGNDTIRVTPVEVDPVSGDTRYGLELLPFVSELYLQHTYHTNTLAVVVPPVGPLPGVYSVEWILEGPLGFAVEIRNPFRRPIRLRDSGLLLRLKTDGGTEYDISLDPSVPGSHPLLTAPPDTLQDDDVLVIHQRSGDGSWADDAVSPLVDMGGSTTPVLCEVDVASLIDDVELNNGELLTVELLVKEAKNGNHVAYQKVVAPEQLALVPLTEGAYVSNTDPDGQHQYTQRWAIGTGEDLNILTAVSSLNVGENKFLNLPFIPPVFPSATRVTATDKLGVKAKGNALANGYMPGYALAWRQILIADRADAALKEVGELAMIAVLGFSDDETLPEFWQRISAGWTDSGPAASPTPPYLLALDPAATLSLLTTDEGVLTYGQVLLDHFTTLSPQHDGLDNDGDNKSDEAEDPPSEAGEEFVFGSLNLNTAPHEVIARALPIADPHLRLLVADNIVAFRNAEAGQRKTGLRTDKGIASIGELFNINLSGTNSAGVVVSGPENDSADNNRMNYDSADPQDTNDRIVQIDFQPDATDLMADNFEDDIEEKTLVARWLAQVGAVRSDVFTAYILVRGYRGLTDVPEVEKRVMVIFDRSGVTNAGDSPRVLARIEF